MLEFHGNWNMWHTFLYHFIFVANIKSITHKEHYGMDRIFFTNVQINGQDKTNISPFTFVVWGEYLWRHKFWHRFSPGMSLKLIWNILIPQQFQDIPQNIFFLYLCRTVYEKDHCCTYRRWIVAGKDKYLYGHIFASVYIILQITVQISWLSIHTWLLTHWGRVTHICVSELTIIGSDNGLSPGRRQAITWNNVGLSSIEPLGTNFSEISIGIQTFSFKKMHLNMSSGKCRPFCLVLNVLNHWKVVSNGKQMNLHSLGYAMPQTHDDMEILSTSLALCEGNPLGTSGLLPQRASDMDLWCLLWC